MKTLVVEASLRREGNHITIARSEHGPRDRDMADDELRTQIASMLKDESATKDR
jgi:hypothetical protein